MSIFKKFEGEEKKSWAEERMVECWGCRCLAQKNSAYMAVEGIVMRGVFGYAEELYYCKRCKPEYHVIPESSSGNRGDVCYYKLTPVDKNGRLLKRKKVRAFELRHSGLETGTLSSENIDAGIRAIKKILS